MRRLGIDTNVLIYAHLPSFSAHDAVRRFLLEHLEAPETTLAIVPLVFNEFLHIVTDARRFDPPVTMTEAISLTKLYLDRSNVEIPASDEAAVQRMLRLQERHRLGRKRLADTLLAATLLRHGITELVTCNPGDFALFDPLRTIDPRGG